MIKGKLTYEDLPKVYQELAKDLPIEGATHVPKSLSQKSYDATSHGYQYHVNRLNEVLFGHWREYHKEIRNELGKTKTGKPKYEIVYHMIIELGNWIFNEETGESHFQVLQRVENYGGHTSLEYDSAKKGAFSNAFKKTSSMLGVGNKTYLGLLDEDMVEAEQSKEEVERKLNGIRAIKALCIQKNIDVSECGDLENMSLEEITNTYKKMYSRKTVPKKQDEQQSPSNQNKQEKVVVIASACRENPDFGTHVSKEINIEGVSFAEDLPAEKLEKIYLQALKVLKTE